MQRNQELCIILPLRGVDSLYMSVVEEATLPSAPRSSTDK